MTIEGERRSLAPGIELAAYRVIQEALTNVRKHAPAALARARVTYGPQALEIVVEDDGSDPKAPNGRGHGIVGMRERVQLYGGSLEAGARKGGGFRVHARLPLDGAPR